MPLPSLYELRKILQAYETSEPYKPSVIWTRTEALSMKPKTQFFNAMEELRLDLSIKKEDLEPIAFFYERYSNKRGFVRSKYTPQRFALISRELYKATDIIFNSPEIMEFEADVAVIVNASLEKWGRIMSTWRSLGRFTHRMTDLKDFWEINSQSGGDCLDARDREIKTLKTDMIYVYRFMKFREIK